MSCEACGWAAAVCSMLAFGSFGVPIKSQAAMAVDIDPLVFQSYKTAVCFATSWLILLTNHVEYYWTPWGIVSGLFWVPGGVATIYAVKAAGLAVGIGIGSSFIVLVSFVWGIFIFQEPVHSKVGACVAIASMMLGLAGMSYYSSPVLPTLTSTTTAPFDTALENNHRHHDGNEINDEKGLSLHVPCTNVESSPPEQHPMASVFQPGQQQQRLRGAYQGLDNNHLVEDEEEEVSDSYNRIEKVLERSIGKGRSESSNSSIGMLTSQNSSSSHNDLAATTETEKDGILVEPHTRMQHMSFTTYNHNTVVHDNDNLASFKTAGTVQNKDPNEIVFTCACCCGWKVTRRHTGMMAAAFCGIWGGSILAPMKFCHDDKAQGTGYLISFAIGASIVTVSLWILRWLYYWIVLYKSPVDAYHALPSFHLPRLWWAGGLCGLLWSIGNFFSLLSVYYLGEGVGYPLVQTSILVSGLWGIFYFKEVTGRERIGKWLASSLLTIFGILLLSYMHHKKTT